MVLDEVLPGLDKRLAEAPLATWEQPDAPGLAVFKEAGGPALLVPQEHGGLGGDLLTATQVQRAIGSRSPSLAVATTMHHFSMASLVELAARSSGMEWMLLTAVARDSLLVASGFAEGRAGQGILTPTMTATERDGVVVLNGTKKPCSLARSMDLLSASVVLPGDDGNPQLAIAVVPASSPGVSVRPFWNTPSLAGAESDEVTLTDVEVPQNLVVRTELVEGDRLDHLQTVGFVWFELLMSASYLGAATALADRLLGSASADVGVQAQVASTIRAATLLVEGTATRPGAIGEDRLADVLVCRYAVQDAITRVLDLTIEALGGMAFISSGEVAYLAGACRALAFHPPGRHRMASSLRDYFTGGPLRVP
ncbi:acyl-CoA dehydrogenase family protein [Micromonospora andamanensis]|uniref:acyl-CoA dehydrogenase family protein n=1 Tax=Micromonospora andamanensis TaxID=1287068 RepID=UPI001EF2B24C|nr:acyl-CoA dehydrogenase family protein [Micromonospora andamanensis]